MPKYFNGFGKEVTAQVLEWKACYDKCHAPKEEPEDASDETPLEEEEALEEIEEIEEAHVVEEGEDTPVEEKPEKRKGRSDK